MSQAPLPGQKSGPALLVDGVETIGRDGFTRWRHRKLRLCLVNLMPNKAATEAQIARLITATSIPVTLTLCVPDSYRSKSMSDAQLSASYRRWSEIREQEFDALIITGAPVETLPFESVTYWDDLCAMFDWARSRGVSSFNICWAAQAALRHFHNVPKHGLAEKMFGVFAQRVEPAGSRLLVGMGPVFLSPVSRHTEVRVSDLPAHAGLKVLATSDESGLCLVEDTHNRAVCMFNHLEYDTFTLRDEFVRDRQAGKPTQPPRHYFPDNDPARCPTNTWQGFARALFGNWLGEVHRAALRRSCDRALIQWALATPHGRDCAADDLSEFLAAAVVNPDGLLRILRVLAVSGIVARGFKVHRPQGGEQLIELRTDPLSPAAAERAARRLGGAAGVLRVAFRTCQGAGGWLAGDTSALAPLTWSSCAAVAHNIAA
jgi:homoserine O-succinyltransferase/O-acetyltransferase